MQDAIRINPEFFREELIMKFNEYLREQITKVNNSDEKCVLVIIIDNSEVIFKYHNNCFADFHEDFVILYDKSTKTNMAVMYDKIECLQYADEEIIKAQRGDLDMVDIMKELFT